MNRREGRITGKFTVIGDSDIVSKPIEEHWKGAAIELLIELFHYGSGFQKIIIEADFVWAERLCHMPNASYAQIF